MANPIPNGFKLSTAEVAPRDRYGWLMDVIRREYVKVEVRPPGDGELYNEMTIYPWKDSRLSVIRSRPIGIERLPGEPHRVDQDAYFAVVLLAGRYSLEQQGKSVLLRPGDLTLYDATRPHRIECPANFAKLIVSIPRTILGGRVPGIEHCTALRVPGDRGLGAVASSFIRAAASQAEQLKPDEFRQLSGHTLDLLAAAFASLPYGTPRVARERSVSLALAKDFIERHLADPDLNAAGIACGVGLSARYIRELFLEEGTSPMRHVWRRRLENCRRDLLDARRAGRHVSEIAFRWGFNDASHFSRTFKRHFGCSPREYRGY